MMEANAMKKEWSLHMKVVVPAHIFGSKVNGQADCKVDKQAPEKSS